MRGISLDLRDREYLLACANSSADNSRLCEQFARTYADPVVARESIENDTALLLDDAEERTALVYLELMLQDKYSEMALTKFSFEALVIFSLRNSTVKSLFTKDQIVSQIVKTFPCQNRERVDSLVISALDQLTNKGVVKLTPGSASYCLNAQEKILLDDASVRFALEKIHLREEIATIVRRIGRTEGIDYEYDSDALASDIILILNYYFGIQGQHTAKGLLSNQEYRRPFSTTEELTEKAVQVQKKALNGLRTLSSEQYFDIVPLAIEQVINSPTAITRNYFRRCADGYMITFFLQENPDVQKVVSKLIHAGRMIVDTSYLIPCFAEISLNKSEQRHTSLLKAANEFGMKLIITQDILNELLSHLRRVRHVHSQSSSASDAQFDSSVNSNFDLALLRAFKRAKLEGRINSLEEYLHNFVGDDDPRVDMIESVKALYGIDFLGLSDEYQKLDNSLIEKVVSIWKKARTRRHDLDEQTFDLLIRHDVKAYMPVQNMRGSERTEHSYGYGTWWLTLDRTAFKIHKQIQDVAGDAITPVTSCMGPDFLLRYLSVVPQPKDKAKYFAETLPLTVDLAGMGLIPSEFCEQIHKALKSHENLAPFVQRRQVRNLLNRARSASAESKWLSNVDAE